MSSWPASKYICGKGIALNLTGCTASPSSTKSTPVPTAQSKNVSCTSCEKFEFCNISKTYSVTSSNNRLTCFSSSFGISEPATKSAHLA